MFAERPLSFELYGEDIASGRERDVPDMSGGVDRTLLEQELKMSCSNVMLQCLDAGSRCIYVLGTMFCLDSRIAAEILGMTPDNYRQRLSRIRKKMRGFLSEYCGLSGTGMCSCGRRIDYAAATHRLHPDRLEFQAMETMSYEKMLDYTKAMEELDELSQIFSGLPAYRSPESIRNWVEKMMISERFLEVTGAGS